jgi:hypothetical protein
MYLCRAIDSVGERSGSSSANTVTCRRQSVPPETIGAPRPTGSHCHRPRPTNHEAIISCDAENRLRE